MALVKSNSVWKRMVDKYGEDYARQIRKDVARGVPHNVNPDSIQANGLTLREHGRAIGRSNYGKKKKAKQS